MPAAPSVKKKYTTSSSSKSSITGEERTEKKAANAAGKAALQASKSTSTASTNPSWSTISPDNTIPGWLPGAPDMGSMGGTGNTANDYYNDALKKLEQQRKAAEEAARRQTQQTIDSINSNIPGINQGYDDQQRQNYISHTKNMFGLPDFLKAMGYSGGMSETEGTRLTANYQNSRNTADQNKNNALAEIQRLVAQAQMTGDTSLAQIATDYYNSYVALSQAQAQQQEATRQWQAQYDANRQQYADSQTQQAWENQFKLDQFGYQQSQDVIANNLAKQRLASGGSGGGSGTTKDQAYASEYTQVANGSISPEMIRANMQALIAQYGVSKYTELLMLAEESYRKPVSYNGLTNQGMSLNWKER